jgi:putative transcriptional regulator
MTAEVAMVMDAATEEEALARSGRARSSFCMRTPGQGGKKTLAGQLLVAHPSMADPNFRRAVLFISAHEPDEGALAVILNQPLDKHVSELVTEPPPEELADVPVYLGGPVGRNQLMFAAFEWGNGDGLRINHSVNADEASAIAGVDAGSICAFVGYAGWSPGQLEAEMKQKAWVLQKPNRSLLKRDRLPKLWFEIMKRLGPWYKLLSVAPDDPSLN